MAASKVPDWDEVARRVADEMQAIFLEGRSRMAKDVELIACWSERHTLFTVFRPRHASSRIQGLVFDVRQGAHADEDVDVAQFAYSIVVYEIVEPNRYPQARSSASDAIHWRSMPPSSALPSSVPASVAEIKDSKG